MRDPLEQHESTWWSDIRITEDALDRRQGVVTVFRMPSNNSNGNTFDFRVGSFRRAHGPRIVLRTTTDPSPLSRTPYNGMRLNHRRPGDASAGSYWLPIRRQASLVRGGTRSRGQPDNVKDGLNRRRTVGGVGTGKREIMNRQSFASTERRAVA